jgi:hypothetical protein
MWRLSRRSDMTSLPQDIGGLKTIDVIVDVGVDATAIMLGPAPGENAGEENGLRVSKASTIAVSFAVPCAVNYYSCIHCIAQTTLSRSISQDTHIHYCCSPPCVPSEGSLPFSTTPEQP